MTPKPHDLSDLYLAPVVLAVDRGLSSSATWIGTRWFTKSRSKATNRTGPVPCGKRR